MGYMSWFIMAMRYVGYAWLAYALIARAVLLVSVCMRMLIMR